MEGIATVDRTRDLAAPGSETAAVLKPGWAT